MDGKSKNLTQTYIEQLKALFPEAITEVADKEGNNPTHKVDMEKLAILLGETAITTDDIEYRQKYGEKFSFEWVGKRRAIAEANKRSTGTLLPCPEDSVDWDTTQNLYIEGDNLEVLKLLQNSYLGAVKMIYIDPPYNTGKDFVYKDNYKDNLANYLEQTNTTNAVNTEASGRYHTNWLNMMYPRLRLARNLLADDGVIFISIDDNEVSNLKTVCDEIFGEDNFIECISWNKRIPKNDKGIGNIHEFILLYAKSDGRSMTFLMKKDGLDDIYELVEKLKKNNTAINDAEKEIKKLYKKKGYDRGITLYNSLDNNYNLWGKINMSWPNADTFGPRYEVLHPQTGKVVKIPDRGWRWKKETFDEAAKIIDGRYSEVTKLHNGSFVCGKIWFDKDENTQPSSITYLDDVNDFLLRSILSFKSDGGVEVEALFGDKSYFSYPKPTTLLNTILSSTKRNNGIILDFFSGSATTAHAVMQLNAEDGGSRKYICVQIPEQTPEDSEAYKFLKGLEKPTTIPEIAKERIRRAGNKIVEEQLAKAPKKKEKTLFGDEEVQDVKLIDKGFKVFKLDRSNIVHWDVELKDLNEKEAEQQLKMEFERILNVTKGGRTELDLLYEVMLKLGLQLTTEVAVQEVAGKTVYVVGDGVLVASFAKGLTYDQIAQLIELKNESIDSDLFKLVLADESFATDNDKTNAMQLFKQRGITNYEII